jgi:hypothetical protein
MKMQCGNIFAEIGCYNSLRIRKFNPWSFIIIIREYLLITIREDLDAISSIFYRVFEITPFKRDYDTAFGKISDIIRRYGIIENHRNLRLRFTLCMQEFWVYSSRAIETKRSSIYQAIRSICYCKI